MPRRGEKQRRGDCESRDQRAYNFFLPFLGWLGAWGRVSLDPGPAPLGEFTLGALTDKSGLVPRAGLGVDHFRWPNTV